MEWLELSVAVDYEATDSVAELLARYGYGGGVVMEPAWTPGEEGPEFTIDPTQSVILRTYLPLDAQVAEIRQQIEQALWHLGQIRPIGPLETRALDNEDWEHAWKQHYQVQRIGARTVIVPSWLEYMPQPDDIILQLDPGMAFGTGLHPTTQLCVRQLEHLARPGQSVLDLGTGSGILAIAAAKLGAAPILALDNDPIAVQVARDNVARNGVAHAVQVALGSLGVGQQMGHWLGGTWQPQPGDQTNMPDRYTPLPPPSTPFDLICANLVAKVLIILAHDLTTALAPGGILLSSGIILARETDVARALAEVGLTQQERHQEGEWVALIHTREG